MNTPEQTNAPIPRLPWILLGLLTIASFGGPFLAWLVIRGGESAVWPPDRLVEWVVFAAIVSAVVVLMLACSGLALAHKRSLATIQPKNDRSPIR